MFEVTVIDRYSGDIRIYHSKTVEVHMETKTLVLDEMKVRLFTLDQVKITYGGNPNADQT